MFQHKHAMVDKSLQHCRTIRSTFDLVMRPWTYATETEVTMQILLLLFSYTMLMEFNPLDVIVPAGHTLRIELTEAGEDYLPGPCATNPLGGLSIDGGTIGLPLIDRPVDHDMVPCSTVVGPTTDSVVISLRPLPKAANQALLQDVLPVAIVVLEPFCSILINGIILVVFKGFFFLSSTAVGSTSPDSCEIIALTFCNSSSSSVKTRFSVRIVAWRSRLDGFIRSA